MFIGTSSDNDGAGEHSLHFLSEIEASQMWHTWSMSLVVAIVVILIGFITFFAVLLRDGPF